jgi:aminopeptidase C
VIDLSNAKNVFCIISYKEKKIQESVHTRYMKKIIEGIKAVQELESLMYEIENEYGSKIFKKTWNSLSPNDQMQTEYCFDAIIRKTKHCKEKAIPLEPYSKEPSF